MISWSIKLCSDMCGIMFFQRSGEICVGTWKLTEMGDLKTC